MSARRRRTRHGVRVSLRLRWTIGVELRLAPCARGRAGHAWARLAVALALAVLAAAAGGDSMCAGA